MHQLSPLVPQVDRPIKQILIIEDDETIRELLKEIFQQEEVEVLEAQDGLVGLKTLELIKTLPDLILLDVMMPVMNGFQFLNHLQGSPRFSEIPVIVMSADPQARIRIKDYKISGLLQKPIDIDALLNLVKIHLQ